MKQAAIVALAIVLGGCAVQPAETSRDAEYRQGDRMARMTDEQIACRRAEGIVIVTGGGRAPRSQALPQYCVQPGILRLL